MQPVPVVHIITKLELGGAQQNTLFTVKSLDRERFSPVLIAGAGGYLDDEARSLGIPFHTVPELVREIRPALDLSARKKIVGLLEKFTGSPYIVHTHSSKAGIVGRWAARSAICPVVIHSVHGFGHTPAQPPWLRGALKLAEKATARVTDHFITVSEANRSEGEELGFFNRESSSLIRSGFDLATFRNAAADRGSLEAELGIPEEAPLVLMVGNLKPQKNPVDFARVAGLVSRQLPEAHYILTGEGELEDEVRAQVESEGLFHRFHLPGWRPDVPQLMKSSQAVVLTSLWEGLPRVIPQARAAGRPVVANAVDGSAEAIRDGEDGYLVRAGDVTTMADRIVRLLSDPELREEMGRKASLAVAEFDQELMVRQQEELYERLLREKGLWPV
jgi:glycosyltransferase involved in cell wall biosynthesis